MAGTTGIEPATSDVTGLQSEITESLPFRNLRGGRRDPVLGLEPWDEPRTEPRKAGGRDFGRIRCLAHGGRHARWRTYKMVCAEHANMLPRRRVGAVVAIIAFHFGRVHSRRCDNVCASLSAQTVLGGVLGGKSAIYTMITSRKCL
jgi:hypothetical protein